MTQAYIPPFAALRAFEAVGRLGGIRKAAAEIGVSHTIVSRHLAGLEAQLGIPLYTRNTGELTPAGKDYHGRISHAVSELAAATRDLRTTRRELLITCAPGLALYWLSGRLHRFSQSFPDVMLNLRTRDHMPDLLANEVDGDIRYVSDVAAPNISPRVTVQELARPIVFPVATPQLLEAIDQPIRRAADLANLPLLEEAGAREWQLWFHAQGVDSSACNIVARFGHAQLGLAAARGGHGIVLSNQYLVADDVSVGRLVPVRPLEQPFEPVELGGYAFLASSQLAQDRVLAQFRKWVTEEFRKEAEPSFDLFLSR